MDDDGMLDSYRAYVQSQCSHYVPGNEDFLSGEIVFQFYNRKSLAIRVIPRCGQYTLIDVYTYRLALWSLAVSPPPVPLTDLPTSPRLTAVPKTVVGCGGCDR